MKRLISFSLPFWCLGVFLAHFFIFFTLSRPVRLRVVACDVGQGDAILVSYGQSHVLLDTGPNSAVLRCLQANVFFGDRVIDVVIVSHGDKDHSGGLSSIAKQYKIEQILWNGSEKSAAVLSQLERVAGKEAKSTFGSVLAFPGLRHYTVWNQQMDLAWFPEGTGERDENNFSVGSFWTGESFGFLSLGDLECNRELAVASASLLTSIKFLKVSHHGSKFSSCLEFLQKIHPETAIISVGRENTYGHPGGNIISNLEKVGVMVLRTDLLGEISLERVGHLWRREREVRQKRDK